MRWSQSELSAKPKLRRAKYVQALMTHEVRLPGSGGNYSMALGEPVAL
jgi:hypothetical protein